MVTEGGSGAKVCRSRGARLGLVGVHEDVLASRVRHLLCALRVPGAFGGGAGASIRTPDGELPARVATRPSRRAAPLARSAGARGGIIPYRVRAGIAGGLGHNARFRFSTSRFGPKEGEARLTIDSRAHGTNPTATDPSRHVMPVAGREAADLMDRVLAADASALPDLHGA